MIGRYGHTREQAILVLPALQFVLVRSLSRKTLLIWSAEVAAMDNGAALCAGALDQVADSPVCACAWMG